MPKIPILLLAAGASSRMGTSKALLSWNKEPLIVSRIHNLLATGQKVYVVLGAYADMVIPTIKNLDVTICTNNNWKEGMSTSIAFAVKSIQSKEDLLDGILIATIDQPLVDTQHLTAILTCYKEGQQQIIVSESSNGWRGVPALFDAHYLDALCSLKGDSGAKKVVNAHSEKVCIVNGGEKLVDMDTPERYKQLLKATHQL
ncbi:nucleotidyltransferase family protein [Flavobacteriaceae bacterium]|nr:nucleotidyltransferase family protein [Flavobacteriaceae bacterium]MDB9903484.1 nucleotidyltransferase family protein [Flavobacteriaceae bacterium]MDC1394827.1 nucleotidyltransferase family protein [Flavobacteriaceae bacterium]